MVIRAKPVQSRHGIESGNRVAKGTKAVKNWSFSFS